MLIFRFNTSFTYTFILIRAERNADCTSLSNFYLSDFRACTNGRVEKVEKYVRPKNKLTGKAIISYTKDMNKVVEAGELDAQELCSLCV